jgi:hypothetical protein
MDVSTNEPGHEEEEDSGKDGPFDYFSSLRFCQFRGLGVKELQLAHESS